MNAVLDRPSTTIAFRAWWDQQECNPQPVGPMDGTSMAGERIVRHSRVALLPTAPEAGVMTAPDPAISGPRRSVRQRLKFPI